MNITIAKPCQGKEIASMIMEAMNHECCQNFAGPHHTLEEFHALMSRLVASEDTQYSYKNTLTALSDEGEIMGICVSYDGGELLRLRQAFIDGALEMFGIDYSGMDCETQPGELYIDSLCVKSSFRGHGIASALLKAAIQKAKDMDMPKIGLLVDKANVKAEQLYYRAGFGFENETTWGGHAMKHLTIKLK